MKAGLTRWLIPGLLATLVAITTAVLVAVALAIADLYVTGHGGPSLARPWISWSPVVSLSRADVILLAVAATAFAVMFFATKGSLQSRS